MCFMCSVPSVVEALHRAEITIGQVEFGKRSVALVEGGDDAGLETRNQVGSKYSGLSCQCQREMLQKPGSNLLHDAGCVRWCHGGRQFVFRLLNESEHALAFAIEKLGMTKQHRLGDTGSARAMADHHDIRVTDGDRPVLYHWCAQWHRCPLDKAGIKNG